MPDLRRLNPLGEHKASPLQIIGNKKIIMKNLIYIFLFSTFFINYSIAQQCTQPGANIWKDTWVSCDKTLNPKAEYGNSHWIQYDFGAVRNLSKTWVWNTNDPTRLDQGFNLVKIDYSEDGQEWTALGEMNFPKAKGEAVYGGFSGPDLSNLKAQFVLLTAVSNHGDATCAGLAEIKFNLLPEGGVAAPETNDEEDEEEDEESNEDICSLISTVDPTEFVEVETEPTVAVFYLEIEEEFAELPFIFEYRSVDGTWETAEIDDQEIYLEELTPGTTYEYRISLPCDTETTSTSIGTFHTVSCGNITEVSIEEIGETDAFILWNNLENLDFYIIEFGIATEEKEEFEVEEAEVYLDDLEPNTTYEFRVGTECGEEIIWSELTQFTTKDELDLSTSINSINLSARQVHLFPNPTPGQLTVRIKTAKKDILSYSISDVKGRILFRNTTELQSGSNDLSLNLSNLTDGTYWINGTTINQRARISEQIIKISR